MRKVEWDDDSADWSEDTEKRYVWPNSPQMAECSGCSELRKQVEDLKNMLMSASVQQRNDSCCYSTFISERRQIEIDQMLMAGRHKADAFQQAYETKLKENRQLKSQLDEKVNEVAVLKEQNAVYAGDFQMEREDRERSQSRVIDLEQQLDNASRRIAELEDDRQRSAVTASPARHHQNGHMPVHGAQPGRTAAPICAPHNPSLPSYNSVYQQQPVEQHHSRSSQRYFGSGGVDVCDNPSLTESSGRHGMPLNSVPCGDNVDFS